MQQLSIRNRAEVKIVLTIYPSIASFLHLSLIELLFNLRVFKCLVLA